MILDVETINDHLTANSHNGMKFACMKQSQARRLQVKRKPHFYLWVQEIRGSVDLYIITL